MAKKKVGRPRKRRAQGEVLANKINAKRSMKARIADWSKTARKPLSPTSENIGKWKKDFRRIDIKYVDTWRPRPQKKGKSLKKFRKSSKS